MLIFVTVAMPFIDCCGCTGFIAGATGQGTWNPLGKGLDRVKDPLRPRTEAAYICITVVGEICVPLHIVAGIMFGLLGLILG